MKLLPKWLFPKARYGNRIVGFEFRIRFDFSEFDWPWQTWKHSGGIGGFFSASWWNWKYRSESDWPREEQ